MNYSPIEWTNFTSNPLQYRDGDGNVVWGCIHASPGCMKCYSEQLAKRYGRGGKFDVATMEGLTPFINEKEIHSILTYKPASGKMCFLGDMTDIFGEWVPIELIAQIFNAMAARPDVTFQILTKRAERMQHILSGPKHHGLWTPKMWHNETLPNVHIGVSAENQKYFDERVDSLGRCPAAVRFVSIEPMLEDIDTGNAFDEPPEDSVYGKIHWVIVGGESGPGARPFNIQWARSVVLQCKAADVPVFVKQMGSKPQTRNDQVADVWYYADGSDMDTFEGWDHPEYKYQGGLVTLKLKDRKGGTPEEWPIGLRVREFPA